MTFIFRNRTIFWDIPKWNRGQTKWDGGSTTFQSKPHNPNAISFLFSPRLRFLNRGKEVHISTQSQLWMKVSNFKVFGETIGLFGLQDLCTPLVFLKDPNFNGQNMHLDWLDTKFCQGPHYNRGQSTTSWAHRRIKNPPNKIKDLSAH